MPARQSEQSATLIRLAGHPGCTTILTELADGRALTARELVRAAGLGRGRAEELLAQLVKAGVLVPEEWWAHRFLRLADAWHPALASLDFETQRPTVTTGPRMPAMRLARSCYGHLAGRLGMAVADHLLSTNGIHLDREARRTRLTSSGCEQLASLGIALDSAPAAALTSIPCRPCLDWSERRPHLGGRLGALILDSWLSAGWLRRGAPHRVIEITPAGASALRAWLGPQAWASLGQFSPESR